MRSIFSFLFILPICFAFNIQQGVKHQQQAVSPPNDAVLTRNNFLLALGGGTLALTTSIASPASAKDDADVKGTKKDPSYESCVSKCLYSCTKPKGTEQKSRAECLPECKQECATTKAQLLIGDPKPN